MEKFERMVQTEKSRSLIEEGLEDKKQLEEMEKWEDIERYVQNFYHDMDNENQYARPNTRAMFPHIQDLVDFVEHQLYGDRVLDRIVPDLYRRYFTTDYRKYDQEYDEQYIDSYKVRQIINDFAELYAMTGIPPSIREDIDDYRLNPLVICFERITQDPETYEENLRTLNSKFGKSEGFPESDLWVEALGEKPDLSIVMQLESMALDAYLNHGDVTQILNAEHLKNVYDVFPLLDAKQRKKSETKGNSLVREIVKLLNDPRLTGEDLKDLIYGQASDELRTLESLTGFEAKFSEYNDEIRQGYDVLLADSDPYYYFEEQMGRLEKLAELTGIPLGFSSHAVKVFYDKALRQAPQHVHEIETKFEQLKSLIPLPKFSPEDVGDIWRFVINELVERAYQEGGHENIKRTVSYISTELKADPQPFLVKAAYKDLLLNMREFAYTRLSTMKELFGELPVLSEEEQREIYTAVFIERGTYAFDQYRGADVRSWFVRQMEEFRQETGLSPLLDERNVQEFYGKLLRERVSSMNDFLPRLNFVEEVNRSYGITADYSSFEQELQRIYNLPVNVSDGTKDIFERITEITGIQPVFDPERVKDNYNYLVQKSYRQDEVENISWYESSTKISPPAPVFTAAYLKGFEQNDRYTMEDACRLAKEHATDIDYEAIANSVIEKNIEITKLDTKLGGLTHSTSSIGLSSKNELYKALNKNISQMEPIFELSRPKDFLNFVTKLLPELEKKYAAIFPALREWVPKVQENPWASAISRIERIQHVGSNEANDPWTNEFTPLIETLFSKGVLSTERPEDADLLVQFISETGMVNLPHFFNVYADCKRAKNFENLSPETCEALESFGIQLRRPDGSWRFQNPLQLIGELNKRRGKFQEELLNDAMPAGLETTLGGEMFTRLKGTTSWKRGTSLRSMISTWRQTGEKKPELAKLPPYFTEKRFEVTPLTKRTEPTETTKEEVIEKMKQFLSSKEVIDTYRPLAQAFSRALRIDDSVQWWEETQRDVLTKIDTDMQEMKDLLATTPETIDELIAKEQNEKQRALLEKKIKMLKNPKARGGFESQLKVLETTREKFASLKLKGKEVSQENSIASCMEALQELSNKLPDASTLLRQLSALHVLTILEEGWKTQLTEQFYREYIPNEDRIEFLANFARQYMYEHYLHESQEQVHTNHAPFSTKLVRDLKTVWQQQQDAHRTIPIERTYKNLRSIVAPGKNQESQNTKLEISMVPVAGLLRIFSGDIGDACYTSRHEELARGEYPNLKAWMYVTNRGKANEALRGSVLTIETYRDDGVPAFLVRANNPRENFIQSVDADMFTRGALHQAVAIAKESRKERMKNARVSDLAKRQCVVIPLDRATQSSTNREPIASAYRKYFGKEPRIGLTNEPETNFNNYKVWKKDSTHASVVVWEIDKDGNEIWTGNWGD